MFITFEGVEGSGKTSALRSVVKKLEDEGYPIILTREPGGTPISEEIRNVILDKKNVDMDPITEAYLYAASRRQHLVEKVWPSIKEGKIVISDRYLDSSLAYQGGARNLGIDTVLEINRIATDGYLPDITIYFDLAPEIGLARIAKNANREVNRLDLEKMDFHQKVRKSFIFLSEKYPERYRVIDASKDRETIVNEVYQIIKEAIKSGH